MEVFFINFARNDKKVDYIFIILLIGGSNMNVAILGTGFGQYHLKMYHELGINVVSIFGRNEEKLKEIKKTYDVETTSAIEKILCDPQVDLVDICLPTDLHYEWVIKSLQAGKHVYCETPIAYSEDECLKMIEISNKTGKFVYVDLFFKFSYPHRKAVELSESLGKLVSIKSYNQTASIWGDLSLNRNLHNFHIHHYDFIQELVKEPLSAFVNGQEIRKNQSQLVTILKGDILGVIESHSGLHENSPFIIGFELIFESGVICFRGEYGKYNNETFYVINESGLKEELEVKPVNDHLEVIKHVKSCFESNKRSDLVDIKHALKSLQLLPKLKKNTL